MSLSLGEKLPLPSDFMETLRKLEKELESTKEIKIRYWKKRR